MDITKEEWIQWRDHPVTKEFVARVLNQREALKEGLVEGHLDSDKAEHIAIGRCQGMKDMALYALKEFEFVGQQDDQENDDNV